MIALINALNLLVVDRISAVNSDASVSYFASLSCKYYLAAGNRSTRMEYFEKEPYPNTTAMLYDARGRLVSCCRLPPASVGTLSWES